MVISICAIIDTKTQLQKTEHNRCTKNPTSRCEPAPWLLIFIPLRSPHLVLSYTCRDDGIATRELTKGLNCKLGQNHTIIRLWECHWPLELLLIKLFSPTWEIWYCIRSLVLLEKEKKKKPNMWPVRNRFEDWTMVRCFWQTSSWVITAQRIKICVCWPLWLTWSCLQEQAEHLHKWTREAAYFSQFPLDQYRCAQYWPWKQKPPTFL